MDVKIVNFCGSAKLTGMQSPSHQSLKMRHRLLMRLFLASLAAVVASNWWFAEQVSTVVKILLGAVCLTLFVATSIYARKLRKNLSQAQAERSTKRAARLTLISIGILPPLCFAWVVFGPYGFYENRWGPVTPWSFLVFLMLCVGSLSVILPPLFSHMSRTNPKISAFLDTRYGFLWLIGGPILAAYLLFGALLYLFPETFATPPALMSD